MLRSPRMSLENTTKKIASVTGPFIKWSWRKTIKREKRLPESCLNPRAYSLHHQLNLAQHANLDCCYCHYDCLSLQVVADEAIPRLVYGIKGTMNDPEDPEAQMVLIAAAQDMLQVGGMLSLYPCIFTPTVCVL